MGSVGVQSLVSVRHVAETLIHEHCRKASNKSSLYMTIRRAKMAQKEERGVEYCMYHTSHGSATKQST